MSYASNVKEELSRQMPKARHCQIAEMTAIVSLCGHITISEREKYKIRISTENISVARKYFTLLRETFNIYTEISIRQSAYQKKGNTYTIVVTDHEASLQILQAAKLIDEQGDIYETLSLKNNTIVMKDCCKRAFLRGAFLATGSISDPNKSYHLEIVCQTEQKAGQVQHIMMHFDLDAKIVRRNRHFVVYIKESEDLALMLNVMEAHVALMDFENIRILKDMRNDVNRKVNCETANLNKIVKTAYKQIEDIKLIQEKKGLDALPDALSQVAKARLANPDVSLQKLGTMLSPTVGKSGVNHRLRKLGEIASELREQQ